MFIGPKALPTSRYGNHITNATEIDDTSASLDYERVIRELKKAPDREVRLKLGDVLSHPELFNRYPELKTIDINATRISRDVEVPKGSWGAFGTRPQAISIEIPASINGNNHPEYIKRNMTGVILHEVQHVIQQIERWPNGSIQGKWTAAAKDLYKRSEGHASKRSDPLYALASTYFFGDSKARRAIKWPRSIAELHKRVGEIAKSVSEIEFDLYMKDPGEVQARATQNRYLGNPPEPKSGAASVRALPYAPVEKRGWKEALTSIKLTATRAAFQLRERFNQSPRVPRKNRNGKLATQPVAGNSKRNSRDIPLAEKYASGARNTGSHGPSAHDVSAKNPTVQTRLTSRARTASDPSFRPMPSLQSESVKVVADFFGTEVAVLPAAGAPELTLNGARFGDTTWIHERSVRPLHTLFGHGLLHKMKVDKPILYSRIHRSLSPLLSPEAKCADQLGLSKNDAECFREVLIAALVVDRFADKQFWKLIASGADASFNEAADYVSGVSQTLIERLRSRGLSSTSGAAVLVADLEKAQEAVSAATSNSPRTDVALVRDAALGTPSSSAYQAEITIRKAIRP